MKKKLTILIFSLSLMAFVSIFLQAKETNKQNKDVIVVYVEGLVCDFCAVGLNKTFKKQKKTIDSIEVDLKKSLVKIFLKANKKLSDKKIKKLIEGNGFDVVSIERPSKK